MFTRPLVFPWVRNNNLDDFGGPASSRNLYVEICWHLQNSTTFAKVYDYQVKVGMLKAENGDADHGIGKHV